MSVNTHPSAELDTSDKSLRVSLHNQSSPVLNVEMQCHPGEMLALVGPSGSGKSTVLRTIAGLQNVEIGRISCNGETWLHTHHRKDVKVQQRNVGMVFQHYALFPHKSVEENVSLGIRGSTRAEKKQIAANWLERTNMTGLEKRNPNQLSGGQKQRVALARALASNPSVLLLDEPFSAVDQQTRRKLYRELAKLRCGLDIPMILVTHDVREVQQLADSMCLIHKGQTLQQGSVHDVISAPRSKAIAKLLGHQNLFAACVSHQDSTETCYQLGDTETLHGEPSDLAPGTTVTLLISPSAISLAGNSSHDQAEHNVLHGLVRDAVSMGDEWSITVHLHTVTKSLRFRLPQHLLSSGCLAPGSPISVNIRRSGIFAINDTHSV